MRQLDRHSLGRQRGGAPLPGACPRRATDPALRRDDGRHGGRDLSRPRRAAARHRAGGGAGQAPVPGGAAGADAGPLAAAARWGAGPAAPPADDARRHRLELRPARGGGGGAVPPPRASSSAGSTSTSAAAVSGREAAAIAEHLEALLDQSLVRREERADGGPAVRHVGDDPRIRPRSTRGEWRARRGRRSARGVFRRPRAAGGGAAVGRRQSWIGLACSVSKPTRPTFAPHWAGSPPTTRSRTCGWPEPSACFGTTAVTSSRGDAGWKGR